MPVIKQLNPINTFVSIEFDMLVDVDFGLLRLVGSEYADERIFYTEIFENDENVIKGLLMERENYNPLTVPAKEDTDIILLNSLYDEFIQSRKADIINCSDITSIFEWVIKLLHSGSNIMVSIICKDSLEKSIIKDMMDRCNTYNYEIITMNNDEEIDMKNTDVLVSKFSKNLFFYNNLHGKTIYLADLMCNSDLDMFESKHVKFPNIDAVLYCEDNEFKFMTMYPYDDSYSINGEFYIPTNDEDEENYSEEDAEKYVFEDDDEVNHGDISLLESWLSPEELEAAKVKNHVKDEDKEEDDGKVTLEFFNPYKDRK